MSKKLISISIIVIIVGVVLVAFVPGALNLFGQNYEKYNLDVKTFKEKYRSTPNAVLLDVRTPEEVQKGKIEGAKDIDFYRQDFHQQLDSLDKNKEYYVYCQSGVRSGKTCVYLSKKGYACHYLKGGFEAWEETGN